MAAMADGPDRSWPGSSVRSRPHLLEDRKKKKIKQETRGRSKQKRTREKVQGNTGLLGAALAGLMRGRRSAASNVPCGGVPARQTVRLQQSSTVSPPHEGRLQLSVPPFVSEGPGPGLICWCCAGASMSAQLHCIGLDPVPEHGAS